MKFKFKLQKVLQHRKVLENLAQAEFAEAQLNLQKAEERLQTMKNEIHKSEFRRHEILTSRRSAGMMLSPIEELKQIDDFLKGQKIVIERQQQKVQDLQKTVEIRREILRNKVQEVKIIDKLKEKQKAEFISEFEKEEQAQMDERASLRHSFNKNEVK